MNTEKMLQEMRDCYLQKDFAGLRRKYYLSKAFLNESDRVKIERVLESERQKLVAYAIEQLGGREI